MVITIDDRDQARTLVRQVIAETGLDYVYEGPADRKTWVSFAEDGTPCGLLGRVWAALGLTLSDLRAAKPGPQDPKHTDLNWCSGPNVLRRAGVLEASYDVCWALEQAQGWSDSAYPWWQVLRHFEQALREWDDGNRHGSLDRMYEGYDTPPPDAEELQRLARLEEDRLFDDHDTIHMMGQQLLRDRHPDWFPPA